MVRRLSALAAALVLLLPCWLGLACAETNKIRVGKAVGGSGFHIPSYVAMDRGFYKAEGLDAHALSLALRLGRK